MTILSILKKVPIFRNITDKNLKRIEDIFKEKHFKKDEYIFSESSKGSDFYIVYEGQVKIYKMSAYGQIKALAFMERGDFFGEMALLDKHPRSANALATKDSILFTIAHDDFKKFLVNRPEILLTIAQTLCQRLRKADQEIEMFSFNNVKDRLIVCLINLSDKYGEDTDRGIRLAMKFTHQDLSELVGTAREVITRIIRELKREQLLMTSKEGFIIPSISKLRKKIAG